MPGASGVSCQDSPRFCHAGQRGAARVFRYACVAWLAGALIVYMYWYRSADDESYDKEADVIQHLRRFMSTWCRLQRARVDWESILKVCGHNLRWESAPRGWDQSQATDADKSFISRWDIQPAGLFSSFTIQSVTSDGKPKTIGGDSWRILVVGPSAFAPHVFDSGNGTYEVVFLVMEPGVYDVQIVLDYTLCNGYRDPPDDWFVVGNSQGKMQPLNMLGSRSKDDYLMKKFRGGEPVMFNVPLARNTVGAHFFNEIPLKVWEKVGDLDCGIKCNLLWDGHGRWVNYEWKPFLKERVPARNVSSPSTPSKDTLWLYGDSLARRMHAPLSRRDICLKTFKSCVLKYNWCYAYNGERPPDDDLDFDRSKVTRDLRAVLEHAHSGRDSGMVLNLGLHYLHSTNFSNFQYLMRDVVELLNRKTPTNEWRYETKVIWKTTTAISKHKDRDDMLYADRKKFLSWPRVLLYNAYSTSLVCKEGLDVLDVYPLTSSYPNGTGGPNVDFYKHYDIVHYEEHVLFPVDDFVEDYFNGYRPKPVSIKNYRFALP